MSMFSNFYLLSIVMYLFYPVMYRRIQKKKTSYCTQFGHSLWSVNQITGAVFQKRDGSASLTVFEVGTTLKRRKRLISLSEAR